MDLGVISWRIILGSPWCIVSKDVLGAVSAIDGFPHPVGEIFHRRYERDICFNTELEQTNRPD